MGNKLYRHLNTGTIYEVLFDRARLEANWTEAVIYRDVHDPSAPAIARSRAEFFDGRFQFIGYKPTDVFDPLSDITEFHETFDLDTPQTPRALDKQTFEFRNKFMLEEHWEWQSAQRCAENEINQPYGIREEAEYQHHLEGILDALVDQAYVLFGTVYMHGMSEVFVEAWNRVHRQGNMTKVRAELDGSNSKRNSSLDVVKPAGWKAPKLTDLVESNDFFD